MGASVVHPITAFPGVVNGFHVTGSVRVGTVLVVGAVSGTVVVVGADSGVIGGAVSALGVVAWMVVSGVFVGLVAGGWVVVCGVPLLQLVSHNRKQIVVALKRFMFGVICPRMWVGVKGGLKLVFGGLPDRTEQVFVGFCWFLGVWGRGG